MTTHDKLVLVLHKLIGTGFKVSGEEIIYNEGVTPPTEAEIDAEITKIESGVYEIEQWRKTAILTRRKFMLAYKRYPWGVGTLKQAIDSLITTLLESSDEAEKEMGQVMEESLAETTEFTRTHPDVIEMATAIGMSPEQIDEFYKWAENEQWRNK